MEDNIFDKYKAEIEQDAVIDDFNLKESQLLLPGRKHKWVARLMQHKYEKQKLLKLREDTIIDTMQKIKGNSEISLSDRTLRQKIENTEDILKIDALIDKNEVIIEYLEKIEKIFSNITYDIKNLIEIRKLELL